MSEFKNKPEPKKIKMPPLVDRSNEYDTMSWYDGSTNSQTNENYQQNNSQGIQQLETKQIN